MLISSALIKFQLVLSMATIVITFAKARVFTMVGGGDWGSDLRESAYVRSRFFVKCDYILQNVVNDPIAVASSAIVRCLKTHESYGK